MIIDIPDKNDFFQSGISLLNLAWDSVAALYVDLEYSELEDWDDNGEVAEEFWQAAQRPISVSLALAQQGIELLIKGRIAEISPFLLLVGSPREWPSGCSERDTPFADFRTIEAHELIRAHDAVVATRFSNSFKTQFERLRRLRNLIFHGVAKSARPKAEDVFRIILEAVDCLYQPKSWIRIRRDYLENTPRSVAYSTDQVELILISEVLNVIKLLNPSEIRQYFGFNKKQRAYICNSCAANCRDAGLEPKVALLSPNTASSTKVYCFICDKHYPVVRKKCGRDGCLGNVFDEQDDICLTCYR